MRRQQPQKIFLDSRFSTSEDGSLDLPNNGITCRPHSKCWLSEFSTVASWWTIDETNFLLYVRERIVTLEEGLQVISWNYREVQLMHGPYDMDSLATEIALQLNGFGKDPGMGTYTCERSSGALGVGGGSSQRCFIISASLGEFEIPSEATLRVLFGVPDHHQTRSTNYLFSFSDGDTHGNTHISGFVDLRRTHNLYLHTPGFGAYSCLGPRGSSNILAKIPVSVGYGQPLHFNFVTSELDGVEVGVHAVNRLKIELRDVLGNEIDLRGGHWSATLVFED